MILESYAGALKALVTRQRETLRPIGKVALLVAEKENDVQRGAIALVPRVSAFFPGFSSTTRPESATTSGDDRLKVEGPLLWSDRV
jgi:hypothetical protein